MYQHYAVLGHKQLVDCKTCLSRHVFSYLSESFKDAQLDIQ